MPFSFILHPSSFILSAVAWFTPSLDLCKSRLRKEWSAIANAAKAGGEEVDDVVQRVIDSEVARIRGRVPKTDLRGEDGTIPDELRSAFLALWVYEFLTQLPGMKGLLDDLRVRAWERAHDDLRDLAMGRIQLVPPVAAAPDAEQAAGPGVEIARPGQAFEDMRYSGLL